MSQTSKTGSSKKTAATTGGAAKSVDEKAQSQEQQAQTTAPPVETFKVVREEDQMRTAPLKEAKTYFKWKQVTKQSSNADDLALLSEGRQQEQKKRKCVIT